MASAQVQDEKDVNEGRGGASGMRTCIVSRQARPPHELIRFVLDPQGKVTPDLKRTLPGRGVWVSASAQAVRQAVARRSFARAMKAPADAPQDLAEAVERLLERDALQSLSLANKAGLIVTGAAKVESAIAKEPILALLHASDGGLDGSRKIQGAIRRRGEPGAQPPLIQDFDSAQLDLALGRSNVIHAAVKKGPAGEAFLARCARLALYRRLDGAPQQTEEILTRAEAVHQDAADGIRNG